MQQVSDPDKNAKICRIKNPRNFSLSLSFFKKFNLKMWNVKYIGFIHKWCPGFRPLAQRSMTRHTNFGKFTWRKRDTWEGLKKKRKIFAVTSFMNGLMKIKLSFTRNKTIILASLFQIIRRGSDGVGHRASDSGVIFGTKSAQNTAYFSKFGR